MASWLVQPEVLSHSHGVLGSWLQVLLWNLVHTNLCQNYLIILSSSLVHKPLDGRTCGFHICVFPAAGSKVPMLSRLLVSGNLNRQVHRMNALDLLWLRLIVLLLTLSLPLNLDMCLFFFTLLLLFPLMHAYQTTKFSSPCDLDLWKNVYWESLDCIPPLLDPCSSPKAYSSAWNIIHHVCWLIEYTSMI